MILLVGSQCPGTLCSVDFEMRFINTAALASIQRLGMTTTYYKSLFLIQAMWKVTNTIYTSDGFGQSVPREPSSRAVADSDLSPQISECSYDVDSGLMEGHTYDLNRSA